jgi:hypothetical protein
VIRDQLGAAEGTLAIPFHAENDHLASITMESWGDIDLYPRYLETFGITKKLPSTQSVSGEREFVWVSRLRRLIKLENEILQHHLGSLSAK